MSYNISYDFDSLKGISYCKIDDNNIHVVGEAHCHLQDLDMMSEKTGIILAEYNAQIKYLQAIKNNQLMPQLKALKELYYAMNRSKHFNKKSYETKMLFRAIKRLQEELEDTKNMIVELKKNKKNFIDTKDEIYKRIRKNRNEKLKVLSGKID